VEISRFAKVFFLLPRVPLVDIL